MRPIKHIHGDKAPDWIGDGFFVKTLINYVDDHPDFNYRHTDPFLLFDYGVPTVFEPNPQYQSQPHGIGKHPHKGFETVTIAYAGEVRHADSAGGQGVIMQGDVQWMTAGRGITHEEFHSEAFGQRGGVFSMVQMWVNLPSAHKLTDPKYQSIKRSQIPIVKLMDSSHADNQIPIGHAAIIAGDWQGTIGAATTFTPINVWDIELHTSGKAMLHVPNLHNTLLLVQEGALLVNGTPVNAGRLIQFEAPFDQHIHAQDNQAQSEQNDNISTPSTDTIELSYQTFDESSAPVKLLLLSGEPIGETVAGHGPFVMNTQEELRQTFRDYQMGNFANA